MQDGTSTQPIQDHEHEWMIQMRRNNSEWKGEEEIRLGRIKIDKVDKTISFLASYIDVPSKIEL